MGRKEFGQKKALELVSSKGKKTPATTYSPNLLWLVPSAQCRFTSEFGMGSGGANMLLSPGKILNYRQIVAFILLNRRLNSSFAELFSFANL